MFKPDKSGSLLSVTMCFSWSHVEWEWEEEVPEYNELLVPVSIQTKAMLRYALPASGFAPARQMTLLYMIYLANSGTHRGRVFKFRSTSH